MTVLTDIAALHTGARSVPASRPVPEAPRPGVAHPGLGRPVRPSRPGYNRERPINRHPSVRAPHRPAATACVVRPAARPLRFMLLLGLATAISVVLLAMLGSVAGGAGSVPQSTTVTQVRTGETLWDVAQRSAPGGDTAAVLARIQELNDLPSAAVRPGQPITVPTGS